MAEQWHAGRTVGRTLYKGDGPDDLIGVMDTRALAAQVVAEHNGYAALVAAVRAYRDGVRARSHAAAYGVDHVVVKRLAIEMQAAERAMVALVAEEAQP